MDTLADRIRWIIKDRGFASARDLSRRAGLKSETHVGLILESNSAKVETIEAIAAAGRVEFRWLATGKGPRDLADEDQTIFTLSELAHERVRRGLWSREVAEGMLRRAAADGVALTQQAFLEEGDELERQRRKPGKSVRQGDAHAPITSKAPDGARARVAALQAKRAAKR